MATASSLPPRSTIDPVTLATERTADQFSHEQALSRYENLVDKGLFTHEKEALEFFGQPPAHVLDVGCGTGRTTKVLVEAGFDVTGIDISAEMVRRANQHIDGVTFCVADAVNIPFDELSFDHVLFSYNGLDYIPTQEERKQALRELWRVLRTDGYFVFSSHNARRVVGSNLFDPLSHLRTIQFWITNLRAGTIGSKYKVSGHTRRYQLTPSEQRSQLREVGFDPIATLTQFPFDRLTAIDPWPYYVAHKPGR